jgi:hypothetical protein
LKQAETLIHEVPDERIAPDNQSPPQVGSIFSEGRRIIESLLDGLAVLLTNARTTLELRYVSHVLAVTLPVALTLYGIWLAQLTYDEMREFDASVLEGIRSESESTRRASEENTKSTNEKLERIESRLADLVRHLEQSVAIENSLYYVVIRAVPLNAEQRFRSPNVDILQPGQRVRVVENSGKWLLVVTIGDRIEKEGWVLKKYLKRTVK